jgi:hypothetical protein
MLTKKRPSGHPSLPKFRTIFKKDFIKPSDHDKLLFDDIELHLAESTNQIMNWISVNKPLISHSIKETDRLAIRGVSSIRTYFPAQPP